MTNEKEKKSQLYRQQLFKCCDNYWHVKNVLVEIMRIDNVVFATRLLLNMYQVYFTKWRARVISVSVSFVLGILL